MLITIILLIALLSAKIYINRAKKQLNKGLTDRFNRSNIVYYYSNNSLIKFNRG